MISYLFVSSWLKAFKNDTQALILLGNPEEERDEFITEHDVESMTNLELQQAVKDRDQAIQEKKTSKKT